MRRNNRKIIICIFLFILPALVIYLIGSFTILSWDITLWRDYWRSFGIIASIILGIWFTLEYIDS